MVVHKRHYWSEISSLLTKPIVRFSACRAQKYKLPPTLGSLTWTRADSPVTDSLITWNDSVIVTWHGPPYSFFSSVKIMVVWSVIPVPNKRSNAFVPCCSSGTLSSPCFGSLSDCSIRKPLICSRVAPPSTAGPDKGLLFVGAAATETTSRFDLQSDCCESKLKAKWRTIVSIDTVTKREIYQWESGTRPCHT